MPLLAIISVLKLACFFHPHSLRLLSCFTISVSQVL